MQHPRKTPKTFLWLKSGLLAMLSGYCVMPANAQDQEAEVLWIAGTQPDQRPTQAPEITEVNKSAAWYEQALTGLQPPYPPSFRFLEDQGNWYTPFNHPGMTGRYDLRGWLSDQEQ